MEIREIYYSSPFVSAFKKLPKNVLKVAMKREVLFRANCFDARLKTHKLKGGLSGYWSFSVNYSHRIIFEFIESDKVGFVDIGDHGIYQ